MSLSRPDSPTPPGTVDADHVPDPRRWPALAVLAVGLGMVVLDGTIVGVSMPTIIRELSLDLGDAQWITSLYAVVFAAFLLTAGRLGDRLGRRTLFLAGLALFTAGSIIAAMSTAGATLIGARVVQGLGGAAILPSTLSTVNVLFRGRERAAAFGVWGAVMAGAAAIGPLAGGLLTEHIGWESVFWVNVPIGAALFVAALLLVPNSNARGIHSSLADGNVPAHRTAPDLAGFALSAVGFGALVFGIIEGPRIGFLDQVAPFSIGSVAWPESWPSAAGVALVAAAVAISVFIAVETSRSQRRAPVLVELSMFRSPTFSWGNATALTVAVGEFGLIFVLPLFLVSAVGLSPVATGLVLSAMAAGAFLAGASARHLAARIGAPGTVILGLGLEVAGALQLAAEERANQALWLVVLALLIYGLGLGLASAQLTSLILGDIPTHLSGQASATQSTIRQIGSALGAAISGAVLASGIRHYSADLPPDARELTGRLVDSAGGLLPMLRNQGADPDMINSLTTVFAEGTRLALFAATAALFIGFMCALMVRSSTRRADR